ncbi:MAG TPA: hypothetical protein H9684_09905 [Firmicutes bacterium]|nr:hypothetical protein [Bacillota bacterium]
MLTKAAYRTAVQEIALDEAACRRLACRLLAARVPEGRGRPGSRAVLALAGSAAAACLFLAGPGAGTPETPPLDDAAPAVSASSAENADGRTGGPSSGGTVSGETARVEGDSSAGAPAATGPADNVMIPCALAWGGSLYRGGEEFVEETAVGTALDAERSLYRIQGVPETESLVFKAGPAYVRYNLWVDGRFEWNGAQYRFYVPTLGAVHRHGEKVGTDRGMDLYRDETDEDCLFVDVGPLFSMPAGDGDPMLFLVKKVPGSEPVET